MSFPSLVAYIAFGSTPYGTPTFADVTPYIRQRCSIKRGRSGIFNEFKTGTAALTLLNTDRRFDPDYASGAYAPDVLPMKQIAIGATWDAGPGPVTYWLFTGYIEDYHLRDGNGTHEYADLTCVDGFEVLTRQQIGTQLLPVDLAAATTVDRVIEVLDTVGWPGSGDSTGPRNLDTAALVSLQPSTLEATPALEHIQLAVRSEAGYFFIDREGKAVLQRRTYRDSLTSIDTWGDAADGSELPYKGDLDLSFGISQVFNRIEMQREDGDEMVAEDSTSQTNYLTRVYARTGLITDSDVAVQSMADDVLVRFKDPQTRATGMSPNPQVRNTWPIVLQREISDRITIVKRSLVGGTTLTLDAFIEGFEYDIRRDSDGGYGWDIKWGLSSI